MKRQCSCAGNWHFWLVALIAVLLLGYMTRTQEARAQPTPLDGYVEAGLSSNLALRQQTLDLEKSLRALDEARGMFWPEMRIEARYSRAGGGRQIEFPVGDLMNPVYQTLNDILMSQGQPGTFPTLENIQIPFLREREQDTRFRVVQPLYQPAIRHNYRLQGHLLNAQEAGLDAFRRQLVRDIKVAYYQYLKARRAVEIYTSAGEVVDEYVRVNERLVANEKATEEAVMRARVERYDVEQQLADAMRQRDLARSYFNFLINRPLGEAIELPADEALLPAEALGGYRLAGVRPAEAVAIEALSRRHEIRQLDEAVLASSASVDIQRTHLLPGVALALDLGIQGEQYGFTNDRSYYMASVVLQWKLFDGFQERARIQQAQLDTQRLRIQREELDSQIRLQVQDAMDNLDVARRSVDTAEERLRASREAYRRVSRKYEEGMENQVTMLDARDVWTRAELNRTITRYDLLIRLAELEYATGGAAGAPAAETGVGE
ncbi:MAG: TolC family protein [Rhodothermales bacterium]